VFVQGNIMMLPEGSGMCIRTVRGPLILGHVCCHG